VGDLQSRLCIIYAVCSDFSHVVFFHNSSFSKSVRLLSILFLVTVCSLPSLANKRHHNSVAGTLYITLTIKMSWEFGVLCSKL